MSMLWQRFTERAKRVVIAAQEEAARAGEPYVSPEHLLLGLVKQNESASGKVLEWLGVSNQLVEQEIERQLGSRTFGRLNSNDVTLDPRMKRVLDFAYDESRQSKTNYIGSEHLLLGIIREGDGIAFRTLAKLGVDIVSARKAVFDYLTSEGSAPPASASPSSAATSTPSTAPASPTPASRSPRRAEAETIFHIGKFSEPEEAETWLNGLVRYGCALREASTSAGQLWLIVEGPRGSARAGRGAEEGSDGSVVEGPDRPGETGSGGGAEGSGQAG